MYVARQAIFNRILKVIGYELLFRNEKGSFVYDGTTPLQASASVLGTLFEAGINQIVDDKMAFINFEEALLHSDSIELIEHNRLIIEVLETVQPNELLIDRIKLLKTKGYRIALDDFDKDIKECPLFPHADIIKYDLRATPLPMIEQQVKEALKLKKILLAEKIETKEEFLKAREMGFQMFQGYFFSKPDIVAGSANQTTTKVQYAKIIQELNSPEPSYRKLAGIIEKDVNLAYRLVKLKTIRRDKDLIYSIQQALAYMGLKEIERWINILMLRELSDKKPDELMRISLIRSKFSELIASRSKLSKLKYEAAIMGLFSVIDAMLNQNMADALHDIALPKLIIDALMWDTGELYPIYRINHLYEQEDWMALKLSAIQIAIDEDELLRSYLEALHWADDIMKSIH